MSRLLSSRARKLAPFLKTRGLKLRQIQQQLGQARLYRQQAEELLQKIQRDYLEGLEQANQQRQGHISPTLDCLENSVDYARHQWGLQYVEVQKAKQVEAQMKQQLNQLRLSIEATEDLSSRYEGDARQEVENRAEEAQSEAVFSAYIRKHRP